LTAISSTRRLLRSSKNYTSGDPVKFGLLNPVIEYLLVLEFHFLGNKNSRSESNLTQIPLSYSSKKCITDARYSL
jgi:hypothetical protein